MEASSGLQKAGGNGFSTTGVTVGADPGGVKTLAGVGVGAVGVGVINHGVSVGAELVYVVHASAVIGTPSIAGVGAGST